MSTGTVEALRQRLLDRTEKQPRLSVGDIVDELSSRGRGPFFLVPALVELTPIGSIPGVPTVIALLLAVFAVQVLAGRKTMWLPGFVRKWSMASDKVSTALEKLEKVAGRMDRMFHDRWPILVYEPFQRAAAAVVLLLCLAVPFLEIVPFASSVPMLCIAALGLAMLVHDGRVMAGAALALLLGGALGLYWALRA
ncbi:exopolysaccharide biosynthesis protein [Devosia sediminis]|uniref:Exopolysaccharide biosynthesis protein n=1 Tax=Devosia sediminis TaxID=2798801 RepID=A0A934ML89_9HYPH|nr:exopolysaccharide biosynthesis protein [Devosia sediminis]MBJ3784396.1 exopolysaccharide biosynthesis protein [Devosia sediminis]